MKVTFNWLNDFVDLRGVKPEIVAERLTHCGMEVEEIEYQNSHLHDVVVGKILKIEKHPQADKLVVCQVDIGLNVVQIVTAATNVFVGANVPVSLPGADLCNGIKIQESTLRGVKSYGMFCSGEELGIGEEYFEGAGINGILILPEDFKPGQKIEDALMLNDVIFDVNVTPNRPDCMSVIGIAREVSASIERPLKQVNYSYPIDVYDRDSVHNYVSVEVKTKKCPRYMACAVKDVKIERSPLWMRARLNAVGIKPINTLVDITNYVLIEMGQPLHAFDQSHIEGKKIEVRQAKEGEKIEVLNHNTYTLSADDIVIADANKPMVIAGVIGGTNSCISDSTKTCVFEGAVFDLKSVRVTSKKIGVRTDSSARYSKGVNLQSAERGLKRALHLVGKLNCGKIVRGMIDIASAKNGSRNIVGSVKEIDAILGIKIEPKRMESILNSLGIETKILGDRIECKVPPEREDIEKDCDLAEEIIRIYGYEVYDKLDYTLFANSPVTAGKRLEKRIIENKMKSILVANGFYEAFNYSFGPTDMAQKLLIEDERKNMIKLLNPLGEELSCMRTCMAYGLLNNVAYNARLGNKDFRLFERGNIYLAKSLPLSEHPQEEEMLALVVSESKFDFFMLKGIVEALFNVTNLHYSFKPSAQPYLHPGISADIVSEDGIVYGSFGKIHPLVAKNFEVNENVYYCEIKLGKAAKAGERVNVTKPVPKFPIVERDIAIIVDDNVTNGQLLDAIKSACGKLLYKVELFDMYKSAAIGEGKKSLAYNIKLVSDEKTLTDEEVSAVMKKVLKALEFRYKAALR